MPKHTVKEIRKEYDRLDKLCNFDSSAIELKISKRCVRHYGFCYCKSGEGGKGMVPYRITIADFILDCDEQFWDTIRHEYAHGLANARTGKSCGHNEVWKAASREVGCRPERLSCDLEAHKKASRRRAAKYRYEVRCKECGRTWRYLRAGGVVQSLKKGKTCTCPCGSHKFSLKERKKKNA